ncbi:MAG: hypothetical protein IGQ45_15840, partial [Cyanobacterium sp. T60_A2020_053]|nr:hypothetical protein [Cyanobacterium sp. T60_A2020_053]
MTHNPLDVQSVKCATCPFRIGHRDLVEKLTAKVLTTSNHICHSHRTKICRGSRDLQISFFHAMGVLPAPTDEAYEQ